MRMVWYALNKYMTSTFWHNYVCVLSRWKRCVCFLTLIIFIDYAIESPWWREHYRGTGGHGVWCRPQSRAGWPRQRRYMYYIYSVNLKEVILTNNVMALGCIGCFFLLEYTHTIFVFILYTFMLFDCWAVWFYSWDAFRCFGEAVCWRLRWGLWVAPAQSS